MNMEKKVEESKNIYDKKKFKENFIKGEIFHGILINQKGENKIIINDKSVLFKFFYYQNNFYFILYDYSNIFFAIIDDLEILEINKELNPSLEYKDISSLINFLKDNLIIHNKNLIISFEEKFYDNKNEKKNTYFEFVLNSMVDILSVKWVIKCDKIPLEDLEELSQCIFINPIHNFILGIGNLINSSSNIIPNMNSNFGLNSGISLSDAKMMIRCNYLGKKAGFSQTVVELLNCSSNVVNGVKSNPSDSQPSGEVKINYKLLQNKNKKNKFGGPLKHRKGEKIVFCEDTDEHVTQSISSEIQPSEKTCPDSNIEKEETNIKSHISKEKKKKKKKFI